MREKRVLKSNARRSGREHETGKRLPVFRSIIVEDRLLHAVGDITSPGSVVLELGELLAERPIDTIIIDIAVNETLGNHASRWRANAVTYGPIERIQTGGDTDQTEQRDASKSNPPRHAKLDCTRSDPRSTLFGPVTGTMEVHSGSSRIGRRCPRFRLGAMSATLVA